MSVTHSLPVSIFSVPPQTIFTTSFVPPSTIPPPNIHRTEVGSSSRSVAMSRVVIEVPVEGSLLRKSGQADVWLEPLIGPIEKAKLESHNSLTLMNDIVHATLKVFPFSFFFFYFEDSYFLFPFLGQPYRHRDDEKSCPLRSISV